MKNVIYCLFIVITVSACSTNKYKAGIPRLTAIGIEGEHIPQYRFQYDRNGNLAEITHRQAFNDTNVSAYTYNSSNRITGLVIFNRDTNQVQERARVTSWDDDGNVTGVQYFDAQEKPTRSASIRWEKGLPAAMKYSDSTQAVSWNFKKEQPERKDISVDTFTGKKEDALITLRTTHYEWDDSINPLHPLLNQLLLCHAAIPAVYLTPMGDLSNTFLHLGTQNPFLIKITEKESAPYQQREYERRTTVQYAYSYNGNGYPSGAWVHFHREGFTQPGTDTQFRMEYHYE